MLYLYLSMIEDDEDKEKFKNLFLKYERQLFFIANNIIKDLGLSEDAVQITFFNLARDFKKVSQLDENIVKARLYIMIKNASINVLKKKKHSREVFFGDINEPLPKSDINVENLIISSIEYEKLIKAINELPQHYCEVLYLNQVSDCSIKEIADIMNLKYDTVQKRLKRAKMIVCEKLKEEDFIYG